MASLVDPLLTAAQLGTVLQAARKTQGMTQTALAARIGISQSRVSHLELNAGQLSVEQLMAWCAALNLELAVSQRAALAASSSVVKADW